MIRLRQTAPLIGFCLLRKGVLLGPFLMPSHALGVLCFYTGTVKSEISGKITSRKSLSQRQRARQNRGEPAGHACACGRPLLLLLLLLPPLLVFPLLLKLQTNPHFLTLAATETVLNELRVPGYRSLQLLRVTSLRPRQRLLC